MAKSKRKGTLNAALKALLAGAETSALIKIPATFISELAALPDEEQKALAELPQEQFNALLLQSELATINAAEAAVGTKQSKALIKELIGKVDGLIINGNRQQNCSSDQHQNVGKISDHGVSLQAQSVEKIIFNESKKPQQEELHHLDQITIVADFDREGLHQFRSELRDTAKEKYPADLPDYDFLRKAHVLKNGFLTKAGVLLFGLDPFQEFESSIVNCVVYYGTSKSSKTEHKKVDGNISSQIDKIRNFIADKIDKWETRTAESVSSKTEYSYPMVCIEEIIANALVHRDYDESNTRKVHVNLFSDRIEIQSPGKWASRNLKESNVTTLDKLICRSSIASNPRLAEVISWIKLFEGEGTGIPKSIEDCERNGAPIPHVVEADGFVIVTIWPIPKDVLREKLFISQHLFQPTTSVHNLPYPSIGNLFKGRVDELEKLKSQIVGDKPTAITQAIEGLGGIGKTRLAIEFGWWAWENKQYKSVFFISAETPEKLRASLASLAAEKMLALTGQKEDEQVDSVTKWLMGNSRWLMILDNADTEDAAKAVESILPSLANGSVIITSRYRRWSGSVSSQQLGLLEPQQAKQFLLDRTAAHRIETDSDEEAAEKLAKELGYLPLALEQTAAYIANNKCSLVEYIEEWENERQQVLKWYDKRQMQYDVSVAVTWQRTFEQLEPSARTLLRLSAFLAPEMIPTAMFQKGIEFLNKAAELQCKEMKVKKARFEFKEALSELAAYSMITRQQEGFTVHRIVQEVIQSRIPESDRQSWLESALKVVDNYAPTESSDVRTWPILDVLRPHTELIARTADLAKITEPTSRLMGGLGSYLYTKGLYHKAEQWMRRSLKIDEECFGSDHPDVAADITDLAELLRATNRLDEAESMYRRAVKIFEKTFVKNHPNIATAISNLAVLLRDTNRLSEAEPLMRRALEVDESSFGPEHPNVTIRLNNLAQLLIDTYRLSEAEPLMRRALKIDESSFGPDHPNVARDLNNMAQLFVDTNRFDKAEPLMRRALKINESSFGPDHPNVAIDLNNLAQLFVATNRLDEAEPLIKRSLKIDESSFGPDHPKVARDLNNLAQLLQDTNRLDKAEPLMRRALKIDEASFGPDHPKVARDLNNLAQLLQATNRLDKAEPLMRRALKIDESSFGPDHPDVAIDLNNLAQLFGATNRLDEAEPLMKRALKICEDSLGRDHPNVATQLNNLAQLLQATNRLDQAEPLMKRALKIFEDSLGRDHPDTQTVRNNLKYLK